MDCFATLAKTGAYGLLRYARKDGGVWIASLRSQRRERMDCFAALAKTGEDGLLCHYASRKDVEVERFRVDSSGSSPAILLSFESLCERFGIPPFDENKLAPFP